MTHYHYIFTGAGLSALMTVYRMAVSGKFSDQSILLIDADPKKSNDRTWCFWEQPNGETAQHFESLVSQTWDFAFFAGNEFSRGLELEPYQYKMIRGIDFYNHIFDTLSKYPNITFLNQKVVDFSEAGAHGIVKTDKQSFTCNKIFNSIYNPVPVLGQSKYPVLQQHFIGWTIKSEEAAFNPAVLTFMDFSVAQKGNTRFMYVLPMAKNQALVEYTLFSKDLLPTADYESAIKLYLKKIGITQFDILEKERGSIPMTSYEFWKNNSKNILHIGSAGGWTKASTGYTFKNTVKNSKRLVAFLATGNDLSKFHKNSRFQFYDTLFLDILSEQNHLGSSIFSSMFKKGKAALILKFLDEDTSFAEDLQVIWKCPKMLFIKALTRRLF